MEKFVYKKDLLPIPVLKGHDNWKNLYYKAWELAFENVDYVEKEGWKPILTCMPGVGVTWQWDSCIMTFITNYSNGTLSAFNNLDNLYRLRRESDGFMAMAYNIETEEEQYPGRINPPLMAWVEWERYLITGDSSRFQSVIPAIEGIYDFIEKNRRRTCDLYWFEDSGSSGMDNSPRAGYEADYLNGSDVCFIDLACQQALSAKYMSKIFTVLNNGEKAEFYNNEHARICNLINELHWSEKGKFYYDLFARHDKNLRTKFHNTKTAAAFWTLIANAAKGERCEAVVKHMFNPDEFYTKIPFASLSKDDLNYEENGVYWLGGVWPPVNFVAVRGLCENGYMDLARESTIRYLDGMCAVYENPEYGTIWEAYAPDHYRPASTEHKELCRKDFVGWGGIAPITLLIENIIGLRFDANENTVTFNIADEECGLLNMKFNGGTVSVECTELSDVKGQTTLKVSTEKPFRLVVNAKHLSSSAEFEISQGEHTLHI